MSVLNRVLHTIDRVSEWSGKIVSFGILPIMIVIVYDVVLRYFFRAPTTWATEAATYIFGICWITAGAYAHLHEVHVKMDVVYSRLSRRRRAALDLITASIFFIFVGVIVWQGARFGWVSVRNLESSPSLWGPPLYPIKLFIPIGAFLLLLQGLAKFIRDFRTVFGKEGTP